MSGFRGVLAGVLVLVALEAVLSTDTAANRTSGVFGALAGLVDRLLDPNVAAIPDRSGGSAIADVIYYPSGSDPVVIPPGGKYKPTQPAS